MKNKIALITGGTGGMGKAIGKYLLKKNIEVISFSRSKSNPGFIHLQGNVKMASDVRRIIRYIIKRYKRIDYLLCFAGYNKNFGRISTAIPSSKSISYAKNVIETDLLGTLIPVFLVEPIMRVQGFGRIITVGSTATEDVKPEHLIYQIAKTGLKRLTKVTAKQRKISKINNVKMFHLAFGNVYNPTTYQEINEKQWRKSIKKGWLDSKMHIAPIVYSLITDRIIKKDGSTTRIDTKTAPHLFKEMNLKYHKLNPEVKNDITEANIKVT